MTNKIIYDLPSSDYHNDKAVSRSGLMALNVSPKQYHYQYLSGEYEAKESKSLKFGTAFHTALLEPEKMDSQFVVWSGKSRATKEGKQEYADALELAGQREVITEDDMATIRKMAASILSEPAGKQLLLKKGFVEPSCFWTDPITGMPVKSRPDFVLDGGDIVVDLKTTSDATEYGFQRSVVDYGYDVQAYMQMEGLFHATGKRPSLFVFIVIEKTAPYHTAFFAADAEMIECGRLRYNRLMNRLKECTDRNIWPGYGSTIQNLTVPKWLLDREQA